MLDKVYARLSRETPVTPLNVKLSLESVYESTSATRGGEEIFPTRDPHHHRLELGIR